MTDSLTLPTRLSDCRCGRMSITQYEAAGLWLPPACAQCLSESASRGAAIEAHRNADEAERRLRQSGLPPCYRQRSKVMAATVDGVTIPDRSSSFARTWLDIPKPQTREVGRAIQACKLLAAGQLPEGKRGLYLYGPAGEWKTTIAAAFLASEIEAGKSGRYAFWPDLLNDAYAVFGKNATDTRRDVIDRYSDPAALVLDDAGKDRERMSEHSSLTLFHIFDARYRRDLASKPGSRWILVTANKPIDQLCDSIVDDTIAEPLKRRMVELMFSVSMSPADARETA